MIRHLRVALRSSFIGVLVFFIFGAAVAEEAGQPSQMRALGNCRACVLNGQDHSGQKLTGIKLGISRLSDVTFDRAALGISVFDGAHLERVSFDGADLRGASFTGATLVDVSFKGADLRGAVFEGAVLERTDLQLAHLCNTQMPGDRMDNSDCN